jgi:predicted DsbA family dithiol-disulfide isomerase
VGNGVRIEIYSDIVCPWCYIGKRRLEQALEAFDEAVTLRWRAFQLNPSATSGLPLLESLARMFGGPERAQQIVARTVGVAESVGLDLHFDRAVTANTFDAHRLSWFAVPSGKQPELVEALHRAHFTEGFDVSSHPTLVSIAESVGVAGAEEFLGSEAGVAEVRAELAVAREAGVTGVPTFVLAGKYAVTGAQDAAVLRDVLAEVRRRESETPA